MQTWRGSTHGGEDREHDNGQWSVWVQSTADRGRGHGERGEGNLQRTLAVDLAWPGLFE